MILDPVASFVALISMYPLLYSPRSLIVLRLIRLNQPGFEILRELIYGHRGLVRCEVVDHEECHAKDSDGVERMLGFLGKEFEKARSDGGTFKVVHLCTLPAFAWIWLPDS